MVTWDILPRCTKRVGDVDMYNQQTRDFFNKDKLVASFLGSQFILREIATMLIHKRGHVRGIADFSYQYIEEMRKDLDIGVDVRHFTQYQGIFMLVRDRKENISSMSIDVERLRSTHLL